MEPSCNQPSRPRVWDECSEGCLCLPGFVRNSSGSCVSPDQCPIICRGNEVYSECGANGCQATCARPDLPTICKGTCQKGCVCIAGFIRDDRGVCIPFDQCTIGSHRSSPREEKCLTNETFQDCGSSCVATCNNPYLNNPIVACTLNCVRGCFCLSGYVKDNSSRCVLIGDCPNSKSEYDFYD